MKSGFYVVNKLLYLCKFLYNINFLLGLSSNGKYLGAGSKIFLIVILNRNKINT